MKSLEFEKVSIADVQRELDGERKRADERARADRRQPEEAAVLADATTLWIAGLPPGVRPIALARGFPRIANDIAQLWRRVARCEEYLDSLVVDLRGTRSGFQADVAKELTALRGHFDELHPRNRSAWDLVERGD